MSKKKSNPTPEREYPALTKKERKEMAEDLAEMIRNGELRPAKNQWAPLTLKKASSEDVEDES